MKGIDDTIPSKKPGLPRNLCKITVFQELGSIPT